MTFGPEFPSFWAGVVTALSCVSASVLDVVAPTRVVRLRRGLWLYGGGLGLVVTLTLFALEGIPLTLGMP